jgi:hypothetical protein
MIAIKGIEKIPQTCSDCDLCRGHICKITGTDIIANPKGNCPLVEIVTCKDCKHWKDSDGVYRRGIGAESKCPINTKEVFEGKFYCANGERRE